MSAITVTRPRRARVPATRRGNHAEALRLAGSYRRLCAFYLAELPRDWAGNARGASGIAWHQLRRARTLRMLGLGRLPR